MTIPTYLTPLLPFVYLAAGTALVALLAKLFNALSAKMRATPKLAPLAPVADVAAEALEDGVKAAEKDAGKPALVLLKDAGQAALADIEANKGALLSAAEAEAKMLLDHSKPLQAPGMETVNLPDATKKGFARLGALAALAVIALAGSAFAQTVPCTVASPCPMTPYDFGLTLPALKFPWGGSTSVQVAGGAGFQGEYNLFPVKLPNATSLVPVLSIGGAIYGSVNSSTTTPYAVSIGPTVTFLHAIGVGIVIDLAAGGGSVPLTGVLPGKVGLPNVAGMLSYNLQNIIDLL